EELDVELGRLDVRLGEVGDLGHQLADLVLRLLEQTWINSFFRHGGSREWRQSLDRLANRRGRLRQENVKGSARGACGTPVTGRPAGRSSRAFLGPCSIRAKTVRRRALGSVVRWS